MTGSGTQLPYYNAIMLTILSQSIAIIDSDTAGKSIADSDSDRAVIVGNYYVAIIVPFGDDNRDNRRGCYILLNYLLIAVVEAGAIIHVRKLPFYPKFLCIQMSILTFVTTL